MRWTEAKMHNFDFKRYVLVRRHHMTPFVVAVCTNSHVQLDAPSKGCKFFH